MEDDCLQYEFTLAVGIIKAKYSNVECSFVQSEVNAWRDDENRSLSNFSDTFFQGVLDFADWRTLAKLDDIGRIND